MQKKHRYIYLFIFFFRIPWTPQATFPIPHVGSCSERGNLVYRATTTCKNELNFNMDCIISLWWKKNSLCTFSTCGDLAYPLNSRVLCPAAHWAAVGLSVPSFLSAFSACSLAVIFALPNYSPENEGDWLNWTWLSVSDWWPVCSSVTVRKPVDLRSWLSVCLPLPISPCPTPPSPPSLYDCQTVCRPTSDCCSLASFFVLAMLPPLSNRLSVCPHCSFHSQLVSTCFVISNWRTQPPPAWNEFPFVSFFESQGNREIRRWFIGGPNFHCWMVILENSFPACRQLIAHLILRVFFCFFGWGELYFHWQLPYAGSLSRMKRNEISMCHVLRKLPLQCANLSLSPNWTVVVCVKLPLLVLSWGPRFIDRQNVVNTGLVHNTLVVGSWHTRGY